METLCDLMIKYLIWYWSGPLNFYFCLSGFSRSLMTFWKKMQIMVGVGMTGLVHKIVDEFPDRTSAVISCTYECNWEFTLQTPSCMFQLHYNDVIMGTIASLITSLTIVYSIVYSDADQRKHQSSASLAFVRGIYRGPVNSPHKLPVTWKTFPFDDVIMIKMQSYLYQNTQFIFSRETVGYSLYARAEPDWIHGLQVSLCDHKNMKGHGKKRKLTSGATFTNMV